MPTEKQLNNLRPDAATKHSATTAAARKGSLPPGFEYLQPVVDEFYNGWISDLGGEDQITKAELALLYSCKVCLVVMLLTVEHLKDEGILDSSGNPQPVLKVVATYMNTLRLNLTAVGLERRARDVTPFSDLEKYTQE